MADCCCAPPPLNPDPHRGNVAYRRVLWAVLAINAVMFLIEIAAGLAAGSASLQADALDFLGDSANYAISLLVVGTGTGWPDLVVATIMAALALQGAALVARQAWGELRPQRLIPAE